MLKRVSVMLVILIGLLVMSAQAQGTAPGAAEVSSSDEAVSVGIDWLAEVRKGGITGIALMAVAAVALGFSVERLLNLRRRAVVPAALTDQLVRAGAEHAWDSVPGLCKKHPSIVAKAAMFMVEHRKVELEVVTAGVSDIIDREVGRHRRKLTAIGLAATIAPLLGLLGTMIGMIEAFAKFSLIEDSTEAAIILADSIGKALITTAMGLVIAIPVLVVYTFFKTRLQRFTEDAEESIEAIISAWFLKPSMSDQMATTSPEVTPAKPAPQIAEVASSSTAH